MAQNSILTKFFAYFFIIFFLILLSGCRDWFEIKPEPTDRNGNGGTRSSSRTDTPARPKSSDPITFYRFGRSVKGRPIRGPVIVTDDSEGSETVMFIASIHGDQPVGTPLLDKLLEHLKDNLHLVEGRRVVLILSANPDGVEAGTRNNAKNVDLNHDFSIQESQPETKAIVAAIKHFKPHRIISLRQLDGIDHDGPGAEPLAIAMKQKTDLPIKRWGIRPGSFGEYGVDNKIPIITFGMRKGNMPDDELWMRYGEALIAAITFSAKDAPESTEEPQSPLVSPRAPEPSGTVKADLERGNRFLHRKDLPNALESFRKCKDLDQECRRLFLHCQRMNRHLSAGRSLARSAKFTDALKELEKCNRFTICRLEIDRVKEQMSPSLPPEREKPVAPQEPEEPVAQPGPERPDEDEISSDKLDECPDDPNKTSPGRCGCGKSEESCVYDAGVSLSEKGSWSGAKKELLQVFAINPEYRDVKRHLYRIQLNLIAAGAGKSGINELTKYDCGQRCTELKIEFLAKKLANAETLVNEKQDFEGAKSLCLLVLSIDPGNAKAKEVLAAIGYNPLLE